MGTNEEKKVVEEKKYAQIPRESIRLLAESASFHNISENVFATLAEDANYRLREAVHNATQIMRHSRRRKLTTEDFNKALRSSDIESLYGYNNPKPFIHKCTKEGDTFYIEETTKQLSQSALESGVSEVLSFPHLQGRWLAIEGVCKSPGTGSAVTTVSRFSSTPEKKVFSFNPVSDDLMNYYELITKAILGNDEHLLIPALEDLSYSANISRLLPYLVEFISVGIKKMSHDLAQLKKLLQTIQSLVTNPNLYLGHESYLNALVQSLLYCIIEPLAASINPVYDQWVLRDTAAHLLAKIIEEWATTSNNLYHDTLSTLEIIFKDLTKPFYSHYGAVVAVRAMGTCAMEETILQHLPKYWPHLNSALKDCASINAQIKSNAHKVYGILLISCELIIRSRLKEEFEVSETKTVYEETPPERKVNYNNSQIANMKIKTEDLHDKKPIIQTSSFQLYQEFYEQFGDALARRLPYLAVRNFYVPKKQPILEIFSYPESHMTGEELLEKFNEKDDDDFKSNSIDDGSPYDEPDDISVMSDDHEADPVDLQVKSTVSDPMLGIKLTIAKMRRPKFVKEASPPMKVKLKPKRLPIQDLPFESVPPIVQYRNIVFNIPEVIQRPVSQLKRKRFLSANQGFTHSQVFNLSKKFKRICKKKTLSKDPRVAYKKKFNSCNIMSII